jgi:hypothetical protein
MQNATKYALPSQLIIQVPAVVTDLERGQITSRWKCREFTCWKRELFSFITVLSATLDMEK